METDCQALCDMQIVDVRHVPGKTNVVADGLSRAAEGQVYEAGDGSEWTVDEGWEAAKGLVYDLWVVAVVPDEVKRLRERLARVPMFLEAVDALEELRTGETERGRKRAKHRAENYVLDDGKLWRLDKGNTTRARGKVECINREEAVEMARKTHREGGHWGRDAVKVSMMDKVWCPGLDGAIVEAIRECGPCQNFDRGPRTISLLNPITRRHPFELVVGDYLSMPVGTGGFHTLGVYLDVFSQHMWVFKHKTAGTAKTTIDALGTIFRCYTKAECFMSDGGKHVGQRTGGGWKQDPSSRSRSWPKHLDDAVESINARLLPALKFSPKELLLGMDGVCSTATSGRICGGGGARGEEEERV